MGNKREMSNEKQTLRDKLTAIILLETSKPYKEMDSDLVSECVDFLMELEGTKRLTKAEIEQKINDIPFKGKVMAIGSYAKKKLKAKRIAVIAAVLAVLLAIFAIAAVSFTNAEDSLIDRFGEYIVEIMNGGEHKNFDNIELIKSDESIFFSSVEEFAEHEKIEILFPTWLPEEREVTQIEYYYEEGFGEYYILWCGDPTYSMAINIDKTISEDIKAANPFETVGDYTVYIIDTGDFVQGMFEYNGSYYSVAAYTEEDVLKIIENLEEIK